MTTRSRVIVATTLVGRINDMIYEVPAGLVVIVKSVYVRNRGQSPSHATVYAWRGQPGVDAYLLDTPLAAGVASHNDVWVVLEHGDQLYVSFDTGPIATWISGALLPVP